MSGVPGGDELGADEAGTERDVTESPLKADVAIDGAYIVTMDEHRSVYEDGTILIRDGLLLYVGPAIHSRASETLNARGKLVIPGLIDSHNHASYAARIGVGARMMGAWGRYPAIQPRNEFSHGGDMAGILRRSANAPSMDEESTYWAGVVGLCQLLRGGTTGFVDGGNSRGTALARAARDVGLRGRVCEALQDLAPESSAEGARLTRVADTDALLTDFESFALELLQSGDGRVAPLGSLNVGAGCSDELCSGIASICKRLDIPFYSHLATLRTEEAFTVEQFGRRPIERMDELGVLGPNFIGVHMGFVSDDDIEKLHATNTKIAHCPASSTRLASGYYAHGAIQKMVRRGLDVGLGTDTLNLGSMIQMIQIASSTAREISLDTSDMDVPGVFEMATIGSAALAGWRDRYGTLTTGRAADLAIIDMQDASWFPPREPLRVLASVGSPRDVESVMIGGNFVMRDREILSVDEDIARRELQKGIDAAAARLLAQS